MNSPHFDSDFHHQRPPLDFRLSGASSLAAALAAAYFVFKALQALGYPVNLWFRKLVAMASATSPIALPDFLFEQPFDSEDTTQMQSRPANVLSGVSGVLGHGTNLLERGVRSVTGALTRKDRKSVV